MNYEDEIEDLSSLSSSEQYLNYFKHLKLLGKMFLLPVYDRQEEWTEQLLEREKIIATAHSTLEFGINTLINLLEQIVQLLEASILPVNNSPLVSVPPTNPKTITPAITKKPLLLHNIQTLYVHEE